MLEIGGLFCEGEELRYFSKCDSVIFDENTQNYHIFPEDPMIMKNISDYVAGKYKDIVEYIGTKTISGDKITQVDKLSKKESKQNSEVIFLKKRNIDHWATGRIRRLSCFPEYKAANHLYVYMPFMKNGIFYNINFMRFYIIEDKIYCDLKSLQFEKSNSMYLNSGGIVYPKHNTNDDLSKIKNNDTLCYNPKSNFTNDPCEIIEEFKNFIEKCEECEKKMENDSAKTD